VSRNPHKSGTKARTLQINGLQIRIIHATTGELIRQLILNPAIDYQARSIHKPRPKPN